MPADDSLCNWFIPRANVSYSVLTCGQATGSENRFFELCSRKSTARDCWRYDVNSLATMLKGGCHMSAVLYEKDGQIGLITINRPEAMKLLPKGLGLFKRSKNPSSREGRIDTRCTNTG